MVHDAGIINSVPVYYFFNYYYYYKYYVHAFYLTACIINALLIVHSCLLFVHFSVSLSLTSQSYRYLFTSTCFNFQMLIVS